MDMQKHVAKLEADLNRAEEDNCKLKQENRRLQRELIEAKNNSIQAQLDQAKQHATRKEEQWRGYSRHLQTENDNLQAENNNLQTECQSLCRERDAAIEELARTRAELRQLRIYVRSKQRPAPAATDPSRVEALRTPEKPWVDNGADDDEADPPEVVARRIKQEQLDAQNVSGNKTRLSSTEVRASSSQAAATLEPESSLQQAPLTLERSATPHTHGEPTSAPIDTTMSVDENIEDEVQDDGASDGDEDDDDDMESDDDAEEPMQPPTRASPGKGKRLPKRTSLHSNITVADHTDPTIASQAGPRSTESVASPVAPTQKRKRSADVLAARNKRRRTEHEEDGEEVREELAGLAIEGFAYLSPDLSQGRPKRKSSARVQEDTPMADEYATAPLNFDFKAVCTWHDSDHIASSYDSTQLQGVTADLWDRIEHARNIWEGAFGDDWQREITKPSASKKQKQEYVCVTRKCQAKRTYWGKGREIGMFACLDCVKAGLPCFTFTWEGKFLLLPLHDRDRGRVGVEKDREVDWWIKPGAELSESDE